MPDRETPTSAPTDAVPTDEPVASPVPVADYFRLALEGGKAVEVPGTSIFDTDEVVLRLPAFRAHDLAHTFDLLAKISDLIYGADGVALDESELADALNSAAKQAGYDWCPSEGK